METKPYKAMLALTTDERRALNTLAAVTSLTPNRYVEAVVRARLVADSEQIGLPLTPSSEPPPIDGQLELAAPTTSRRKATAARSAKPKKETTRQRRTGS